jgi:predicted ATPase/DNA-binding SARP family transcriptional activator
MLTLAVLGPVDLRRDGDPVRVPGGKTAELLVRLALDVGTPVRAERLLADLWPDEAHGAAPNTLQSKVSRLRRALGEAATVRGDDTGYTLVIDPRDVDAVRVLRLAEQVALHRGASDPGLVLEACEEALALFRGELLPGAGEGAWSHPYRLRLEEIRLGLVEDGLAARADLGSSGGLVAQLEELVAAHPLRERLWALLVTDLYRAGRQGDALAACARVRRLLADELGIDPGPALQRLEQQVLRQDPDLTATPHRVTGPSAAREAVPGTPRAAPGNLPPRSGSLLGRTVDLQRLDTLLTQSRLVTLTGPAGVGKTRLALEAAASRPSGGGGVWLARLETAVDRDGVWRAIGEALGLDTPTPAAVTSRLHGIDLLLVLDSCEHLVAAAADVTAALLAASPGVAVLATSQVPLRVGGEQLLDLGPLDLTDAVTLFTDRATAHRPYPSDDEETRRTVEEVCRSLDGLPLAIELAAARTRVLPVSEIARRLDDRFALLRDPASHLPPRQSTLRAALDWSYDLLFPDDQRGLWALASFTGGAPLPAVESVLAALGVPAESGLDVVTRLVDRSLAVADIPSRGPARYRLLDSIRDLALERLAEAGLTDVAAAAQARWCGGVADRAGAGVRGPGQAEHLDVARSERANIDAGLAWCSNHDPDLGVRIALGFGWAWVVLGTGVEGADRVRAALGPASVTDLQRAAALSLCGWFEASGGNLDRAVADLEDAADVDDPGAAATVRLNLAFVHTQAGRPVEALALLDGCRPDLERLGLAWEVGTSWLLAAWALISTGDLAAGRAACDRALELLVPLGDEWALGHAEGLLGELAEAEHRYPDARAHLARAADAARALGFEAARAHHLLNLARVEEGAGDPVAARATLGEAIAIGRGCGDLRTVAVARTHLALLLRSAGETGAALALAEQAVTWFAAAGGGDGAPLADDTLAALRVAASGAKREGHPPVAH